MRFSACVYWDDGMIAERFDTLEDAIMHCDDCGQACEVWDLETDEIVHTYGGDLI
jgi:hypothetical protein